MAALMGLKEIRERARVLSAMIAIETNENVLQVAMLKLAEVQAECSHRGWNPVSVELGDEAPQEKCFDCLLIREKSIAGDEIRTALSVAV